MVFVVGWFYLMLAPGKGDVTVLQRPFSSKKYLFVQATYALSFFLYGGEKIFYLRVCH